MAIVDISGLDKAEVLHSLYEGSHTQGMGFLAAVDKYTLEDARKDYERSSDKYFDYLHGRVLKVHLDGDSFDSWGYDRDLGEGAAQTVIDGLRKEKEAENIAKQEVEQARLQKEAGIKAKYGKLIKRGNEKILDCNCAYCNSETFQILSPDSELITNCVSCGAPYEIELLPEVKVEKPKDLPTRNRTHGDRVYLNSISDSMIRQLNTQSGEMVYSVTIPMEESATGFGSMIIKPSQVMSARSRDGEERKGFKNILLGSADRPYKLSIMKPGEKRVYETVELTAGELSDRVRAAREEYMKAMGRADAAASFIDDKENGSDGMSFT